MWPCVPVCTYGEDLPPLRKAAGMSKSVNFLLVWGCHVCWQDLGPTLLHPSCPKSDAMVQVEKDLGLKEEHSDFVQRQIRKFCLKCIHTPSKYIPHPHTPSHQTHTLTHHPITLTPSHTTPSHSHTTDKTCTLTTGLSALTACLRWCCSGVHLVQGGP